MQTVTESTVTTMSDAAVAASKAIEAAFTAFESVRSGRAAEIGEAYADSQRSQTADLIELGRLSASYLADGLLAGVKRADLIDDLAKSGVDESDLSAALKVFHLSRLTGRDLSRVAIRRVRALLPLVKSTDGEYAILGDAANAKALVGLVADGDESVATREAIREAVAGHLGKPKIAAAVKAPSVAQGTVADSPTDNEAVDAPTHDEAIIEPTRGMTPLDAAQAAIKAILGAKDTGSAARAFGQCLVANPKLIGPIVKGIGAWVRDEKSRPAADLLRALAVLVKSEIIETEKSGLPVGG